MSKEITSNIRIYACGGAAINACSVLEAARGQSEVGTATVEVVYLDTARANISPELPEGHIFIIPGDKDGSGGDRRENVAEIASTADAVLARHKPGYLNIVVSSGSGGSGSVIAPQLTARLLKADQAVVPMVIGDARQGHWINNTLGTIATYENISKKLGKAVAMAYFENTSETPPSEVDRMVVDMVVALSVMYSRQNIGLDTRDLYNFLNFDRMTSYEPHLARIDWITGEIDDAIGDGIITAVTVTSDKDITGISTVLPYAKQAVLPHGISQDVIARTPLHLVTRAYPFNDIADKLKRAKKDLEDKAAARTVVSTIAVGANLSQDEDDFMAF